MSTSTYVNSQLSPLVYVSVDLCIVFWTNRATRGRRASFRFALARIPQKG